MAKVACVADLHAWNHQKFGGQLYCGLNDRARLCLVALHKAVRQARVESADHFVVAGDLVHHWNCEPQLLAAIAAELDSAWGTVHLLVGNHDRQSYRGGDHALCALNSTCQVYDYPRTESGMIFVPAPPKDAKDNWLELALEEAAQLGAHSDCLLVLHAGIADSTTPKKILESSVRHIHVDALAELCDGYGIKAVVAGDWHHYNRWDFDDGLEVVQIGCLAPHDWGDDGLDHGSVVYWDSSKPIGQRISRRTVSGPRFVKANSQRELDRLQKAADPGDTLFVRTPAGVGVVGAYVEHQDETEIAAPVEVVADVAGVREAIEETVATFNLAEDTRKKLVDRCIRLIEQANR